VGDGIGAERLHPKLRTATLGRVGQRLARRSCAFSGSRAGQNHRNGSGNRESTGPSKPPHALNLSRTRPGRLLSGGDNCWSSSGAEASQSRDFRVALSQNRVILAPWNGH
jgi:hypothetical protein